MKINCIYSKELELQRVKYTLGRMDFYNNFGYRPLLPKNVDEKSGEDEIVDSIKREWNEDLYEKAKKLIENRWTEKCQVFENNAKKTELGLSPNYDIVLSRYGVGGSYHLPNTIFLNILKKDGANKGEYDIFKSILHEITHLIIERQIITYSVDHKTKELLVSKLLSLLDPYFEENSNNNDHINSLFEKYYPDVEAVVKNSAA